MILHGEGGEQEGEAGHEAAQDCGEADGAAAAVGDSQRRHQQRHGEREAAQQPCGMRNCVSHGELWHYDKHRECHLQHLGAAVNTAECLACSAPLCGHSANWTKIHNTSPSPDREAHGDKWGPRAISSAVISNCRLVDQSAISAAVRSRANDADILIKKRNLNLALDYILFLQWDHYFGRISMSSVIAAFSF